MTACSYGLSSCSSAASSRSGQVCFARKRRNSGHATARLYTTPPTIYGHHMPCALATQNALAAQYGGNTPKARFHAGVDEPWQAGQSGDQHAECPDHRQTLDLVARHGQDQQQLTTADNPAAARSGSGPGTSPAEDPAERHRGDHIDSRHSHHRPRAIAEKRCQRNRRYPQRRQGAGVDLVEDEERREPPDNDDAGESRNAVRISG